MDMKALTYFFTVLLFGGMMISCGESSRGEAHEELVEAERAQDDVVVGIGPEPTEKELELVVRELDYIPNELRAVAGQDLSVSLLNQSEQEHNVVFELPSGHRTLPENVPPAQSDILEFEAPQEPGTYTFYCPVDDHREKGMEGQLIVLENGDE